MDKFTLENYLKKVEVDTKVKYDYRKRFENIRGKITTSWYTIGSKGSLIVHLKIPSEKAKDFFYDVLVEFVNASKDTSHKQFRQSDVKVFSNCPSFVYMNARYCKDKDWLIEWAIPLFDKRVFDESSDSKAKNSIKDTAKKILNEPVKEKPTDIRYEKSLYFSFLYLNALSPVDVMYNAKKSMRVHQESAIIRHIEESDKVESKRKLSVAEDRTHFFRDKEKAERTSHTGSSGKISRTSRVSSTKRTGRTRKI